MTKEELVELSRGFYLSLPPEWQDRVYMETFRVKYDWAPKPTYFVRCVVDGKKEQLIPFSEGCRYSKAKFVPEQSVKLIEYVLKSGHAPEKLGSDCTTAGYELTW